MIEREASLRLLALVARRRSLLPEDEMPNSLLQLVQSSRIWSLLLVISNLVLFLQLVLFWR